MIFNNETNDIGIVKQNTQIECEFNGTREHGERICEIRTSCFCIKYNVDVKNDKIHVRLKTGLYPNGQTGDIDCMKYIDAKTTDGNKKRLYIKYKLTK